MAKVYESRIVTPNDQSSNIALFIKNEFGVFYDFLLCLQHILMNLKKIDANYRFLWMFKVQTLLTIMKKNWNLKGQFLKSKMCGIAAFLTFVAYFIGQHICMCFNHKHLGYHCKYLKHNVFRCVVENILTNEWHKVKLNKLFLWIQIVVNCLIQSVIEFILIENTFIL